MAVGGSPTSRRITAWHHTCCNTVRWSAQRTCDLCGTTADYYCDGVPIGVLMERLHSEDQRGTTVALAAAPGASPAPAQSGGTTPQPSTPVSASAASPAPSATRPPGARPHRPHEEDDAPGPLQVGPSRPGRWSGLHTMWLASAIALMCALGATLSEGREGPSVRLLLMALAAILVVVLVPLAKASERGEAAR